MDRIKCPNCGSTAQVIYCDNGSNYWTTTAKDYVCGCGCHFEVIFEAVKINVLEKEDE